MKCSISNCKKNHYSLSFCIKHYTRYKRYGNPLFLKETHEKHGPICTVKGCNDEHRSKGYCRKHYKRFQKYGDPLCQKVELHGMEGCPEYRIWHGIKQRCLNPNDHSYNRYGGRGINICPAWKNSFQSFYNDMGQKPFPKAQIDRIDNEGDYEPNNCRWIGAAENIRNSSVSKLTIEYARKIRQLASSNILSQKDIGDIYGVNRATISDIVNNKTWKDSYYESV